MSNNRTCYYPDRSRSVPSQQPRSQTLRRFVRDRSPPPAVNPFSDDRFDSSRRAPQEPKRGVDESQKTLTEEMVLHGIQIGFNVGPPVVGPIVGAAVGFISGSLHTAVLKAKNATKSLTSEAVIALLEACRWAKEYIVTLPLSPEGRAELKALKADFEEQEYLFHLNRESFSAYRDLKEDFLTEAIRQSLGDNQ